MQRLLSKILTIRLTPLFPKLTSLNQTGFLRGRSITENFLSAQELIAFVEKGNTPMAIFKVDIHKAFDMLSWPFIEGVLHAIGFPSVLVHWIFNCVLKGASRVIVNCIAGRPITLRRGVRQGDPLSPYVFILAFDFLSRWITRLANYGALKVIKPGVYPSLFYVDDTILFFKPTEGQAQLLNVVLTAFGSISGLKLNQAKSDLITMKTAGSLTQRLASILGCNSVLFPITYLGLPLSNKKLHKHDFQGLIQRLKKKLTGWSAKFFSVAGRLVLVNACLTALPIYFMSVFKIPVSVIKTIDKLRSDFLWHGTSTDQGRMVMVPWCLVTKPKQCGGLGVLDLKTFNLALLSKWMWRWFSPEQFLWKSQLNALYQHRPSIYPTNSVLQKVLFQTSFIFQDGLSFSVGNGESVLFWHHNWGLGAIKFQHQELFQLALDQFITLSNFLENIINPLRLFHHSLTLSTSLTSKLQNLITSQNNLFHPLHNLLSNEMNKPQWQLTGSAGIFSTSSTYNFIKTNPVHRSPLNRVWSLRIPPRIKIFLWQMLQNKIATLDNLQKRGCHLPNRCILCCSNSETTSHLFSSCSFYQNIRLLIQHNSTLAPFTADTQYSQNPLSLVDETDVHDKTREIWAVTFFVLWRERCARTFSGVTKPVQIILQEIINDCEF
ncbi:hypothetical protein LUZ63_015901 [Rhynchospora breviuscula]|uniref:Reverse transcriptase domain-containing protein n=1 Tax=Rhynchospora breviuscula TaxID=2022672 RepID=A0A9Q0CD77_9POAL|nr:hypothetical protein LUZ63_015901 [Rhynchospora breviuscula]